MAMALPYLTKVAVDDFIVPAYEVGNLAPYWDGLLNLVFISVGAVVLGYLADAFYVSLTQKTGQRLIADMRKLVYRRTLRLPRSYFDRHPVGSILTRVTTDMEALMESLRNGILTMIIDFIKVAGYLGMMFWLDWKLTLLVLLILPIMMVLLRFFQGRVRAAFLSSRQALSEATGYLQEMLSGMKTVQLYGAEKMAVERFRKRNHQFYTAQNVSNFYDAILYSLVEGVTSLALALILWYSAGEVMAGLITLGVLVAFMEYIQRLFMPVREFTQQLAVMQRAMAALDHVGILVATPLDPSENAPDPLDDDEATDRTTGLAGDRFESLEFKDVRFKYLDDGPDILKGISFKLQRGQTLAIVGSTGSGKSTVIKLLTRAYSGYEGSIMLNGHELRTLGADDLAPLISMVHQGVFLFGGSLSFNISMGRPSIGPDQVKQAARYVSAEPFILRQQQGYDTQVNQGGVNLSAGQGQLVSFARAVAAHTDLIMLDEATSSVDSMTEHLIQEAVGKLYQDKTVIAIAHRLSTIRASNTILVMEQGQIVESGNHDELMAMGGIYTRLVGELEAETTEAPA